MNTPAVLAVVIVVAVVVVVVVVAVVVVALSIVLTHGTPWVTHGNDGARREPSSEKLMAMTAHATVLHAASPNQ